LEQNARNNAEAWKSYEETEDFKKVYQRKDKRPSSGNSKGNNPGSDDEESCTVVPPKI